jgi:hypothetical protein
LNLTPRQGQETLGDWSAFRVEHNGEEQEHAVRSLAAVSKRGFRRGEVSCVQDAYTTGTGTRYVEVACLVQGRKNTVVVVGATPPNDWPRISPLLERAIAGVRVS